jgi:hypothetical protein
MCVEEAVAAMLDTAVVVPVATSKEEAGQLGVGVEVRQKPRSRTRCLRMKKTREQVMRRRSRECEFFSAVMSWFPL